MVQNEKGLPQKNDTENHAIYGPYTYTDDCKTMQNNIYRGLTSFGLDISVNHKSWAYLIYN